MNKADIYNLLKEKNMWHEITEHSAVYNMEELSSIELSHPEYQVTNLFVRDDKKRNYYLITVIGDKKINLKDFQNRGSTTKKLSNILDDVR